MTEPQNEPTSAEEIKVTLKPLLGIKPKYYLAGIYSLIILAILFYFLLWDGITKPGTQVTIHSVPEGASVHFQGKLYGHTPLTVFFPQGQGELVLSKTSFNDFKTTYTASSNLLLSGLFPRHEDLQFTLPLPESRDLDQLALQNWGRWSALSYTKDYPAPPLFTRFVQDAQAQGWDAGKLKEFLGQQLRYVADPQVYADFGKACGLWTDTPPDNLEIQYGLWEQYLSPDKTANGRLIFWLLINQSKDVRSNLLSSPTPFFSAQVAAWRSTQKLDTTVPGSLSSVNALGFKFVGVPKGSFHWGYVKDNYPLPLEAPFQLPVLVKVNDFWLSDDEVTQGQFAEFVKANPQWSVANRNELMAKNWADANYLAGWVENQPPKPNAAVSGVSWYAAQAYVEWVNSKLGLPGKKASLPSEREWEWAAREAKADKNQPSEAKANALGLSALQDGVWEWTSSSWAPADQLVYADDFQEPSLNSFYRTVKGGCSENLKSEKVNIWDRGVVEASSSNPYLGFRIALHQVP